MGKWPERGPCTYLPHFVGLIVLSRFDLVMQAGTDFGAPPVIRETSVLAQNRSAPLVRSKSPWLCPVETLWGEEFNESIFDTLPNPTFEPETVDGCLPVDDLEIDYYPSFDLDSNRDGLRRWWREEPKEGVTGQEYEALPCEITGYGPNYGSATQPGWDNDVTWVLPTELTTRTSASIVSTPAIKIYLHWGNWKTVGEPFARFRSARVCTTRKGNAICRLPEGPLNPPVQGKTKPPSMVLYDNIDVCSYLNSTSDTLGATYLDWLDFHTFMALEEGDAGNIWDDWERSGTAYVYGRNTTTTPENMNPLVVDTKLMAKYRSHAEITTNGWSFGSFSINYHPNFTAAVRLMNVQKVEQGTQYSAGYTVSKSNDVDEVHHLVIGRFVIPHDSVFTERALMLAMESAFYMNHANPIPSAGDTDPWERIVQAIQSVANIGQGEAYVVELSTAPNIKWPFYAVYCLAVALVIGFYFCRGREVPAPSNLYDWYLLGRRDCGDRSAGKCLEFGQTTDKSLGVNAVSIDQDHFGLFDEPLGPTGNPIRGVQSRADVLGGEVNDTADHGRISHNL